MNSAVGAGDAATSLRKGFWTKFGQI